jgi:ribose 1,5-bisphosphate isomerase
MEFNDALKKIKSIKIQGAENIAVFSLKTIKSELDKLNQNDKNISKKIHLMKNKLIETRPTEPCMRNSLNYLFCDLHGGDIKKQIKEKIDFLIKHFEESKKIISDIGSKKIKSGTVVYTHCHSSTVMDILKKAKKQGKKFEVYNTETRPLFQGRKTAKELSNSGIKITHFVDSGMRLAIKESDLVLLGADSISCEGRVINKIGSELAAEIAKNFDVPFYICTNSWKYEPNSVLGFDEEIEKRHKREVWRNSPKNIKINNYAFEIIKPELITGIISELGIYNPYVFIDEVIDTYPKLFKYDVNKIKKTIK